MGSRRNARMKFFFVSAILIVLTAALGMAGVADAQLSFGVLHGFVSPNGVPNRLLQTSDRNFFGTTQSGGASGAGTVFRMDGAGNVTTLHSFAGPDGANPQARILQASTGHIWLNALRRPGVRERGRDQSDRDQRTEDGGSNAWEWVGQEGGDAL
jgi:uncharacterized repeat protein (TIGR03803 family)